MSSTSILFDDDRFDSAKRGIGIRAFEEFLSFEGTNRPISRTIDYLPRPRQLFDVLRISAIMSYCSLSKFAFLCDGKLAVCLLIKLKLSVLCFFSKTYKCSIYFFLTEKIYSTLWLSYQAKNVTFLKLSPCIQL